MSEFPSTASDFLDDATASPSKIFLVPGKFILRLITRYLFFGALDKVADIDAEYLLQHKKAVSEIINKARSFIETYEWEIEEDRIEYEESVDRMAQQIS